MPSIEVLGAIGETSPESEAFELAAKERAGIHSTKPVKDSAGSTERLPSTPRWLREKGDNWEEEAQAMQAKLMELERLQALKGRNLKALDALAATAGGVGTDEDKHKEGGQLVDKTQEMKGMGGRRGVVAGQSRDDKEHHKKVDRKSG